VYFPVSLILFIVVIQFIGHRQYLRKYVYKFRDSYDVFIEGIAWRHCRSWWLYTIKVKRCISLDWYFLQPSRRSL